MKISTLTLGESEETFVLKFKLLLKKVGINAQKFKHFKFSEDILAFYQKNPKEVSICFIDVNLQGLISIVKLINELKLLNKNIYVGIISSSDGAIAQSAAKATGADFFMKKSGSFQDLEKRMKKFKTDFVINIPKSNFYIYE
jgi:DNA-binding NarL/FixJ family response regulator